MGSGTKLVGVEYYCFGVLRAFALRFCLCAALWAIALVSATQASASTLTTYLEVKKIPNVGGAWQTVTLLNTYTDPVVVCTYNLPSIASPDATIRIQNAGSTSFQVKVQKFETNTGVTASDVHCIIMESGAYTLPDGRKIEAHTILSDKTSGQYVSSGWSSVNTENVSSSIVHSYTNSQLVILGQVMTYNDAQASVFWTFNCSSRGTPPTRNSVCVGKHIGMINDTRANETLGYIAVQKGSGTVNGIDYKFEKGADTVGGTANNAPYNYSVSGDYDIGVLTQAAEDGGNGGWAVLYGADPLPNNSIKLAIEEETFAGDTSRGHTQENVFYGIFRMNQTVDVKAEKSVDLFDGNSTAYALPGNDVIYSIDVSNEGNAYVDNGSMFLVDTLPDATVFYYGDIDDGGPQTGPIEFIDMASGLTFNAATNLGFSDAAVNSKPASFAQCTYIPASGYDPNINHVCFNPSGTFMPSTGAGTGAFTIKFRARIN